MIIDAHAHMVKKPRDLDNIVSSGIVEQVWIMNTWYQCDERGLLDGRASEDEILSVARDYPGFFIPFGLLDFRQTPDLIPRLREKGFVGLKAIMPEKPYDHPDYFPFYEKAEGLGMPILFHTGIIGKMAREDAGERLSLGPTNMRPSMLGAVAAAFPKLKIIGGHLGWPWLEETRQNLSHYSGIWHDMSGGHAGFYIQWLIENLDVRCLDGTNRCFYDKVLFATDGRYGRKEYHEAILKNIRFWELFFEEVGRFYHWGTKTENIMRQNAKMIIPIKEK